jgi:hypothetical protein
LMLFLCRNISTNHPQPPPAHPPGAAARHPAHALPPGATDPAPSTRTTATERHMETATAPLTEAPPHMAARAPRPGRPAPRHPPTTASATAPRPLPTARAAATLGAPRHPPTASPLPPRAPAAPTTGVTRPVRAGPPTTPPPPVPVWVRRPLGPSMLRHLVRTRRLRLPPSALRRPVPGRAAGAPMPRLLRLLVPRPLLPAVGTMARRRRLRTVVHRRRLPRRGRSGMRMMIEEGAEGKMEIVSVW